MSEPGTPFSTRGFKAMVERAARAAGFEMKIHPHMLRNSCEYKLANDGVDTRTIQSAGRSKRTRSNKRSDREQDGQRQSGVLASYAACHLTSRQALSKLHARMAPSTEPAPQSFGRN